MILASLILICMISIACKITIFSFENITIMTDPFVLTAQKERIACTVCLIAYIDKSPKDCMPRTQPCLDHYTAMQAKKEYRSLSNFLIVYYTSWFLVQLLLPTKTEKLIFINHTAKFNYVLGIK